MKEIWVCVRESYDRIERVNSFNEGQELIKKFEEEDKAEGIYEEDFYETVEFDNDQKRIS